MCGKLLCSNKNFRKEKEYTRKQSHPSSHTTNWNSTRLWRPPEFEDNKKQLTNERSFEEKLSQPLQSIKIDRIRYYWIASLNYYRISLQASLRYSNQIFYISTLFMSYVLGILYICMLRSERYQKTTSELADKDTQEAMQN